MPTMNVSLTPELEALVQILVETGGYQSASEVVREALRLLWEREDAKQLAWLRDAVAKAERTAEHPYDFDSILTEARARARRRARIDAA